METSAARLDRDRLSVAVVAWVGLPEGRRLGKMNSELDGKIREVFRELARDADKLQVIKVGDLPRVVKKALPDAEVKISKKKLVKIFQEVCAEIQEENSSSESDNPADKDDSSSEEERPQRRKKANKRKRLTKRRQRAPSADPATPLENLALNIGSRGTITLTSASLQLDLNSLRVQDVTDATFENAFGIIARVLSTLVEEEKYQTSKQEVGSGQQETEEQQRETMASNQRHGFFDLMRVKFHEIVPCTNEDLKLDNQQALDRRFETLCRLDNFRDMDAVIVRTDEDLEKIKQLLLDPQGITEVQTSDEGMREFWEIVEEDIPVGDSFRINNPQNALLFDSWKQMGPTHVAYTVRPACAMASVLRRGVLPPRASALSCLGIQRGYVSFFENPGDAMRHHQKTSSLTKASGLYMICVHLALGPSERIKEMAHIPADLPPQTNAVCILTDETSEGKRWFVYDTSSQVQLHSFAQLY